MLKKYFAYYIKGFELLNHNLIVFFISIFLSFGSELNVIFFNILHSSKLAFWPVYAISILLNLLFIGYLFVPLIAFSENIKGNKITIQLLWQGIRKMFLKNLLLILAWTALAMIWYGLINPPPPHPRFPKGSSLYFGLISIFLNPLFSFFGIFFAIENKTFASALIESIRFTLKNLSFIYLLVPYYLLVWYINFSRLLSPYGTLLSYLYRILTEYIGLIISVSFVLYYHKSKKFNLKKKD